MHSSNQYLSDKIFHLKNKISPNITKTSHLQVIKPLLGDVVSVIPQLLHGGELLPQEDGGLGLLCQLLSSGDDVDDLLLLFVDLVHHLHVLLNDLLSLGNGAREDLLGGLAKLLGGELHQRDEVISVLSRGVFTSSDHQSS